MPGLKRAFAISLICGLLVPPAALAQENWSLLSTPNAGEASTPNQLFEVGCDPSGLAACTAVGTRSGNLTTALRWDGVSWTYQPTPILVASGYRFSGVDCPSATRCLAVGSVDPVTITGPRPVPLAEIWNGSGWTKQTTPVPSNASSAELTDVGCNSTAECTAVGSAMLGGVKTAIAEKWKSPTWALQPVPVPAEAKSSQLDGIACRWSNYCVAVGRYTTGTGATRSLAMFWNGTTWSLQTLTEPSGATQSTLLDVACTGQPTVCMAVGGWKNGNDGNKQFPLAYRFNGSTWTLQSTASPATSIASIFQDVACRSTTSCAAVGSWVSNSGGSNQTLAEDWDGSSWSIEATPNVSGGGFNAFFGVDCRAQGCLGVGYSTNSSGVNRNLSALRTPAPKIHMTYSIGIGPGGLPQGWQNALREAMEMWTWYTPITFSEVVPGPDRADIEFQWLYESGDGQAFDGPGGKVVQAYGPLEAHSGDIYFDQNEQWTAANRGNLTIPPFDILTVAKNAVGHALGITSGTAYQTYNGSERFIPWEQVQSAVKRFGEHPDQRRYFLKNSNTEGIPEIIFETPADGPDSEFSGDWNEDGYDTLGWFEQHSIFCDPPRDEELCQDQVWLYSAPHTSGVNTPYRWTTIYDEFFNQTYDFFAGDWDGGGDETIGYYEGEFTLLEEYSGVQYHFDYGNDGDIPLAGDWNGDGIDTIGMYRRSNSTFYLRNSNTTGNADLTVSSYAITGDQPVVGDWNGDGKDTIGIYRPSSGQWRLNDQNENNTPEHVFYYGNVGGWVRIVGDWDRDGIDTPGFAQD